MSKLTIVAVLVLLLQLTMLRAQELYVFSEPASNMPSKSMSTKLTGRLAAVNNSNMVKQRYMPELMFGISKAIMIHASTTVSDFYSDNLQWESVKSYVKWRFYSSDDVHRHFRMAAFVDGAYSRNPFLYDELNLDGDHSGIQGGLIATQLVNKLAVSGTVSVIKAFNQPGEQHIHVEHTTEALNYSISAGYLLLPQNYTDYRQTNLNLYVEVIGMQALGAKHYMIDIAPAMQFIFNSNTKLNLGVRLQAKGNMERLADRNYYISLERTFLNALKKK